MFKERTKGAHVCDRMHGFEVVVRRAVDPSRRQRVVRLKSGDPGVFGRLDEELDACDAAGIEWQIVPGLTSAAAAAAAGALAGAKPAFQVSSRRMTAHIVAPTAPPASITITVARVPARIVRLGASTRTRPNPRARAVTTIVLLVNTTPAVAALPPAHARSAAEASTSCACVLASAHRGTPYPCR